MRSRIQPGQNARRTFLLDKAKSRVQRFAVLRPEVISSAAALRKSLSHATKNSLWISYERELTDTLVRSVSWPARNLGGAILGHSISTASLAALANCFKRLAYAAGDGLLAPAELAVALHAEGADDLFIGGAVDPAGQTITLWRGNLEPLTVPFAAFEPSGDGTKPDFDQFAVVDCGQTIRLGRYEASADAILYEFDHDYRRRISRERLQSERSFGASLRRLRKQRGLRREDFAPALTSKTIARIEQGKVHRLRTGTLEALARRLRVAPDEIATY